MEQSSAKKSQQPSSSSYVSRDPSIQEQRRHAEKEKTSASVPKTSLESLAAAAQNNQAQQGRSSIVPPRAAMPIPIIGGYGGTPLTGASSLRPPRPPVVNMRGDVQQLIERPARPNNEFLFQSPSQQGRRPWSSPQGYSSMRLGSGNARTTLHAPPVAIRPTNVQGIPRPPPPPVFPGSGSNAPVMPNLKRKAPMQDEGARGPTNNNGDIYRPLTSPNITGSSGQRGLYDKRFEANGIFVDPHLRIFNALRKNNGIGAVPSKKPKMSDHHRMAKDGFFFPQL